MKMLLAGEWVEREEKIEVRDPYDDSIIDTAQILLKQPPMYRPISRNLRRSF